MAGNWGNARHNDSSTKLSDEEIAFVRDRFRERGCEPAAKLLGTSTYSIDKILSSGQLTPKTAAKISARIQELMKAKAA